MNNPDKKIKIAVSSCLLGHNVRYDGNHKNDPVAQQICNHFDCVTVCPEAGCGLGVPRPPLKLIKTGEHFRVKGKTNPHLDVTESIQTFANTVAENHTDICGYIFKSRSPSCGINSTPWFDENNAEGGITSGVFAHQICEYFPGLPVIEETQLNSTEAQNKFIEQIKSYSRRVLGEE